MTERAITIIGKGKFYAPAAFHRHNTSLNPDYTRTNIERVLLDAYRIEVAARYREYYPNIRPPFVLLAGSTSPEEPLGQTFPGFNLMLVKGSEAVQGSGNLKWLIAHEYGHMLFMRQAVDAFFAAHPEIGALQEDLARGITEGRISIQVDHAKLNNALYHRFDYVLSLSIDELSAKTPFEKILREWEIYIRGAIPFIPYSFIQDPHGLGESEIEIFDAYIFFTLIGLTLEKTALMRGPTTIEAVCNYLACVVSDTSIEQVLSGPLATRTEKIPDSLERKTLLRIRDNFPPGQIGELVQLFTAGDIPRILNG